MQLKRPLTAIVPIYNGLASLRELVASLAGCCPRPAPGLKFLFIDDASPDKGVARFLAAEPFFRRRDVQVERNPTNRGFAGTVNRGLAATAPDSDIVLLNTDTTVHGNVFSRLQEAARRFPHVASVTPLTNNGTIASLTRWPEGGGLPFGLDAAEVTRVVEGAALPTPFYNAPTGIGFCMYIPREALDAVGPLDEQRFAKGYGEENDWCQRAIKAGFVNLICTETFVYHEGGQSFVNNAKRELSKVGFRHLKELHPGYLPDVKRMCLEDPFRQERALLLWRLSRARKQQERLRTVTLLLHGDPENPRAGTERHVRTVSAHLAASGRYEVIQVFPDGEATFRIRLYSGAERAGFDFAFPKETFPLALEEVLAASDVLHVHNIAGLERHLLGMVEAAAVPRKLFSAHDYTAVCPSMHLQVASGAYCGIPASAARCNGCLRGTHKYREESIQGYRARMTRFLGSFDTVLAPSQSVAELLLAGLTTLTADAATTRSMLHARLRVLGHFLPFRPQPPPAPEGGGGGAGGKQRIVFLGYMVPHKGGRLLQKSLKTLTAAGYEIEIWGVYPRPDLLGKLARERPFGSLGQLRARFARYRPHLVCMPSIVPETFSYTLYEALLLARAPVVVGPFGNPAHVVRSLEVGQVMEGTTPAKLVQAIRRATAQHAFHVERLRTHWEDLAALSDSGRYFQELEALYGAPAAGASRRRRKAPAPRPMPFHPLPANLKDPNAWRGRYRLRPEHAWLIRFAPGLTRMKNMVYGVPGAKKIARLLLTGEP